MTIVRMLVTTSAVLAATVSVSAQQAAPSSGWVPRLVVTLGAGLATGRTHTSTSFALAKGGGDPINAVFFSGPNLCALGGGASSPASTLAAATNIWKLTGEFLGEESGGYKIRFNSHFTKEGGRDVSGTPAGSSVEQTHVLRDGDAVMLDFMRGAMSATCPVHAAGIEARIVMEPANAALAESRYSADLWLVHTNEHGEETRRHLTVPLVNGNAVSFVFDPLDFPIPQLDPKQADMQAYARFSGVVRLRPRDDGQLDVDLDTQRRTGLRYASSPLNVGAAPNGRKTLLLREGETVAIDLPAANGYYSLAFPGYKFDAVVGAGGGGGASGSGGAAAGGIGRGASSMSIQTLGDADKLISPMTAKPLEVRANRMNMNSALFFKGHKTQILLRIQKSK
jgi:hypothetical protein